MAAEQSAGVALFVVVVFGGLALLFLAFGVNLRGWRTASSKRRMQPDIAVQVFALVLSALCLGSVVYAVAALVTK